MIHGHIKLSRKLFAGLDDMWDEPRVFSRFEAWVDLLQRAAWRATTYATKAHGADELQRGEFVASLRFLGQRWGWGKWAVANFLASCEKAVQITRQRTGHHGTIYLLVNYDTYQSTARQDRTEEQTAEQTATGQRPDSDRTKKKQLSSKSSKAGTATTSATKAVAGSDVTTPAEPKEGNEWIKKAGELYISYVGGVPNYGEIGKGGKALHRTGLVATSGELLASWERYLVEHGKATWCSWSHFAKQYGKYSADSARPNRALTRPNDAPILAEAKQPAQQESEDDAWMR